MTANQNLNRYQFDAVLTHEDLKHVKALDFKGNVGDPDPVGRMEHWQSLFGGTTEARHYDDGDSPTKAVERLRPSIRDEGVREPVHINEWANGSRSMTDGHHRAVAAILEGKSVPARIKVYKDI